jgi:two-component SAPR family response regulator
MRRRRDTLEALWWLALLLVGLPVGLLHVPGRPTLPRQLPGHEQYLKFLQQPLTLRTAVAGLVVIGWTVWVIVFSAVVRDLVRRAAAVVRRLPRLRLPGPVQGLSATVLGAVAVSSTAAGTVHVAVQSRPAPASTGPGPLVRVGSDAGADTHASDSCGTATMAPVAPSHLVDTLTLVAAPLPVPRQQALPALVRVADQHYTYTVKRGDTLWHIAGAWLGNPLRWPEIYHLNQDRYDQHGRMRGGDHIEPSWVLRLPDDASPPADAIPAAPPAPPPGPTQPSSPATASAPSSPPSPAQPPTSAPPTVANGQPGNLPALRATGAGTGTGRPAPSTTQASVSPRTTQPLSPQASGDTPTSDHGERQRPSNNGIEAPGGWLTAGLGAALLFAAATVWRRRRHRYAPTPITTAILDDPDLATPLAARTLIRQRLRRAAPTPDLDEPAPEAGPTVREYVEAERAGVEVLPELPPIGPTGPELAGLGVVPLTGGLGLDGDGALDAARALLIATLSCGHGGDPDARGRVVIPAATLASLIGVTAVDLRPMDRLIVTDTFADAVSYLEEEIIRRSRTIADAQAADVAALRAENAFAAPLPQLLLVAETPEPSWRNRVATALGLGERVDIATVFIGAWNTTLTVAPDGTTNGSDDHGHRVAVLDADSTAEAIAMLGEAHTDTNNGLASVVSTRHVSTPASGQPPDRQPTATEANPDRDEETAIEPAASDRPEMTDEAFADRVQVRVLGHPAVIDATGQPAPKLRAKSVELLVYLAVNRSGASLSDIMEAIWPDATLRRAGERLSTCVANLRGVIRAVAATTMNIPEDTDQQTSRKLEPVINSGGFYRLDPTIVSVDWWTMLDEYGQVAAAPDDAQRLKHLLAAITDLRGPLAEGTDYDWIDTDRERARRHQIKLLAQAADLLADDDPHASRTLLDQACTLDPLSDELARQAMRAAAATGDADSIRHRLDTLRHALDDADIDLDADTEQLAATLLRDLNRHRYDT